MKKQKLITLTAFVMMSCYGLIGNAQNSSTVVNTSKNATVQEYETPVGIFTFESASAKNAEMQYSIQTVNTSGKGTSTLLRNTSLGISQQNNQNSMNSIVSLYPNPFSVKTTVILNPQGQTFTDKINLIVYDLLGNKIQESEIINLKSEINRGSLAAGMYFYKVICGQDVIGKGEFIIQ